VISHRALGGWLDSGANFSALDKIPLRRGPVPDQHLTDPAKAASACGWFLRDTSSSMTTSQQQQTTAVEWPTRKQEEWDLGSVTTEYACNGKVSRRKLQFLEQAFDREIHAIEEVAAAFEGHHHHTLDISFITKQMIFQHGGVWGRIDDPAIPRQAWDDLMPEGWNRDCFNTITALAAAILDKELPPKEGDWSHLDRYDNAIAGFGL